MHTVTRQDPSAPSASAEASVVRVRLNGAAAELEGPLTLADLLARHKLRPETVVIEHNRSVPARETFATTRIHEGDEIEIVKFMGGG